MKLFVEEGAEYREIEVIIRCQKTDSQVMKLISALRVFERKITGYRDGQTFLLEAEKLLYIETVDKKTFLYTSEGYHQHKSASGNQKKHHDPVPHIANTPSSFNSTIILAYEQGKM